jgi:hypothetical protein
MNSQKTKRANKFALNCHMVLISADISSMKHYVLSDSPDKVEIPVLQLSHKDVKNIDKTIIDFMQERVFVSELELMPQLVNLHTHSIPSSKKDQLNLVYGFVINYTNSINNEKAHWVEFNYNTPCEFGDMISEVIRKLK